MARKRRMFDIEIPEDEAEPETFPVGKEPPEDAPSRPAARRGPMAAAISETAEAARQRQEAEAKIRAENDALAHEHVRLKRLGLVVEMIPLEQIRASKLVRDRDRRGDDELDELKESIRALGLSNPIRIEDAGQGSFELVQGWRRLSAYRALLEETGDADRFGTIPAAVWAEGHSLDGLYRRMVDENLVRKDVSFAEMAQLALDYAADPEIGQSDPAQAVNTLFGSAGYQKRSYIRNFIQLMEVAGPLLNHAPSIPRALGVELSRLLKDVPDFEAQLRARLSETSVRSREEELAILRTLAEEAGGTAPETAPASGGAERAEGAGRSGQRRGRARTNFQFEVSGGPVRCTAAAGRIEVKLDRDFTTIDRRKLEAAIRAMLEELE